MKESGTKALSSIVTFRIELLSKLQSEILFLFLFKEHNYWINQSEIRTQMDFWFLNPSWMIGEIKSLPGSQRIPATGCHGGWSSTFGGADPGLPPQSERSPRFSKVLQGSQDRLSSCFVDSYWQELDDMATDGYGLIPTILKNPKMDRWTSQQGHLSDVHQRYRVWIHNPTTRLPDVIHGPCKPSSDTIIVGCWDSYDPWLIAP